MGSAFGRWWTYQKERFPLAAHAPLVAAFSAGAVFFSAALGGTRPSPRSLAVAFAVTLVFFLELRIADEFKDAEDDARFRPYRPVPRGLVTLRELAILGAGAAALQLTLVAWLAPGALAPLLVTWAYLALMTNEFFMRRLLRAHPVAYLLSHMLVVPLIALTAAAAGGAGVSAAWLVALSPLLAVSLFSGIAVEIGRKIRAPEDEETGVETYTALWGRPWATASWLAALLLALLAASIAGGELSTVASAVVVVPGVVCVVAAGAVRHLFLERPEHARSRWFEAVTAVWMILVYGTIAAAALAATA